MFVEDSSSNDDDVDLAAAELKEALSHPSLETLPLLVLANKQDVQGARSADEVSNKSFSSLTSKCIKIWNPSEQNALNAFCSEGFSS